MSTLLDRIDEMEQRVLNARTIEAAAAFHDKLDALRAQLDEDPVKAAYDHGYQAGYHAGIRHKYPAQECDHEGIGLPTCPTCRPRTITALKELGIDWPEDGHDLACGRSPGRPDPLCGQCQVEMSENGS